MTEPVSPHLAIRASAGTGKTFALSNRFLGRLLAGTPPERVLATTFTRKAAGEILDRVLERLAGAARRETDLASLRAHVDAELTSGGAAERLAELIGGLDRLRVGTLDRFALGLVRAFGLELGMPLAWSLAEPATESALKRESIAELASAGSEDELLQISRMIGPGEASASIAGRIDRVVGALHELYRDAPDAAAWRFPEPAADPGDEAAGAAIERLAEVELPTTKSGGERKNYRKAVDAVLAAAERGDGDALLRITLVQRVAEPEPVHDGIPVPEDVREPVAVLARRAAAAESRRLRARSEASHALLARYDAAFRRIQRRRGIYRFQDLPRMLVESGAAEALEAITFRLDGQIDHLLVDEFQDTSVTQWRLLKPLAQEIAADGTGTRSFFCVGDRKQAIYGWRGGEPRLFDTLDDAFAGSLSWAHLDTSRRSAPAVVETVNAVFSDVADSPALERDAEAAREWGADFRPHATAVPERPGHAVLEIAEPAEEAGKPAAEAAVLRRAAGRVAALRERAPAASIGVLVRTNAAVARMIYELSHATNERPAVAASEEGGNPLTDAPAVTAVLAALTLADHPGDTVAAHHVALSPLGPVVGLVDHDDARARGRASRAIRERLLAEGYAALLWAWARALAPACDRRNMRRLLQLADLGAGYEGQATPRPGDFARFVRAKRVEDPGSEPVRVMTIHQAKGLEFDAVVLPELEKQLIGAAPPALHEHADADPLSPVAAVTRYAPARLDPWVPGLPALRRAWRRRALTDGLSALYVALTRARHGLYMLAAPTSPRQKAPPATMAGVLRAALAPETGPAHPEPGELYHRGDPAWPARSGLDASTPDGEPARADAGEAALAPSAAPRGRILPRRTPSAGGAAPRVTGRDCLRATGAAERERGRLLHGLCEAIGWLDEGPPARGELERKLAELRPAAEGPSDPVGELLERLAAPDVRAALCRSAYGGEVALHRERPFAVRRAGAVVQGAFDRLVVCYDGDACAGAEVLDYKTDADDPDRAVDRHRAQLESYRDAAAAILGIERDRVGARIVLLERGEVRSV